MTKKLLNAGLHSSLGDGRRGRGAGPDGQLRHRGHREAMAAFAEKRDPEFRGR